jgi:hypothetical protein
MTLRFSDCFIPKIRHKINRLIRFWLLVFIAVDVGHESANHCGLQISPVFSERFDREIRQPLAEFVAAEALLKFRNGAAKPPG